MLHLFLKFGINSKARTIGGGGGALVHSLDFSKKEKRKKEREPWLYIYVIDGYLIFLITMAINSDTRWGLVQFLLICTRYTMVISV